MVRKRNTQESTAVIDEPVADQQPVESPVAEQQQTVEPAKVYPKARSWAHHNVAGVELTTYSSKEDKRYEAWIRFRDGKPSDAVRQLMKDNGFKWHPDVPKGGNFDVGGAWVHHIGYNTGSQDRLTAERTYAEVVEAILKDKGESQTR